MWTYEQSTGDMISPAGEVVSRGYSGSPEGRNNTLMQAIHNVGPIPVGSYTIGAPVDSPEHGPFALPLTPDSLNEMFGRAGFMCHGDNVHKPGTASEGCIIQPPSTRAKMWDSGDRHLVVTESVV